MTFGWGCGAGGCGSHNENSDKHVYVSVCGTGKYFAWGHCNTLEKTSVLSYIYVFFHEMIRSHVLLVWGSLTRFIDNNAFLIIDDFHIILSHMLKELKTERQKINMWINQLSLSFF